MTAPGDTAEVRVDSIAGGGEGVARLPDGRVCFVHRTAPGDRARIRLTTVKARWARGTLVELLEPGEDRRPPPCPFYDRCGGCTLEHLRYEGQLRAKARIVADALERIGDVPHPPPGPVRPSPSRLRYRSRISFHLRRTGGDRVVAGFHELDHPGRIVDVDGRCLLPEPILARCWDGLRGAWGPGAARLPAGPALRLTLRVVVDGVVLVVEPEGGGRGAAGGGPPGGRDGDGGLGAPAELLDAVDDLAAVWWRTPSGSGPAAADTELLAGDPDAREAWWGREVRTRSGAFLQVNRAAAVELHEAVLREVGPGGGRRVVDAYCGVGSYGRRLAAAGDRATGIELDPDAVAAARNGAPPGFTVLEGRVEERLEEALPADLAILNPPRAGLDETIPARLRTSGVGRIVYVSCDPATLARDLGRLGDAYRVGTLTAFDLFPQTAHVEVLAVLERRPVPAEPGLGDHGGSPGGEPGPPSD